MRTLLIFSCIILIVICNINGKISDSLRVTLPNGSKLLGRYQLSLHGKAIRSYLGVPYAKPPLGPLRFKAPEPAEPWNEIKEFITNSPICTQRNSFLRLSEVQGEEDCLYLNIFVPMFPKDIKLLPVMVFFHGGGFQAGAGSFYGPDYLLDHDVIFIAVNYRLGPLGFLSTGQEDCPGNNGLKDQVLALKWIQENIRTFGGDSNLVTIFGESAGGASVTYHMMSPLSKGLFQRGISQSGTNLSPWARPAHGTIATIRAAQLGDMTGCTKIGNDWKHMIDCLRTIDAAAITATYYDFFKWDTDPMIPFPPVIEPNLPGAFLTDHPKDVLTPHGLSIPWLTGVNSDEVAMKSAPITYVKDLYKYFLETMDKGFPIALYYDHHSDEEQTIITNRIKEFYFQNQDFTIEKNLQNLTNLFSDGWFIAGTDEYLQLRLAQKQSVGSTFLYLLSHEGSASFTEPFVGDPNKSYGTCHADELLYLFPINSRLFPFTVPTREDNQIRKIMIDFWINFARTGNPTITNKKSSIIWNPVTKYPLDYLRIGNKDKSNDSIIGMEIGYFEDRVNFWRQLNAHSSAKLLSNKVKVEL